MRIQLIEHDPEDFSRTNISFWASKKGYQLKQVYVCKNEELPPVDSFDWLMIMGGSQHAWDELGNPWLQEEKAFLGEALAKGKIILGICFGAQLLGGFLGEQALLLKIVSHPLLAARDLQQLVVLRVRFQESIRISDDDSNFRVSAEPVGIRKPE